MSRSLVFGILLLILVGMYAQVCFAQLLNLGGRSIKLVDGNVTDSIATDVIDYSRNLYDRGEYGQSKKNLDALIRTYTGDELGNAYFLRGKANFMHGYHTASYRDFLTLFDGFRSSPPVSSGELEMTISNALDRMVELANLSDKKCCQDIDFRRVDIMIKLYELYKYVSGKSELAEMEKVLATSYTKEMTLTSVNSRRRSGRVESCHRFDMGRTGRSLYWGHVALAILITEAALDEWNYMKLPDSHICFDFVDGISGNHMSRVLPRPGLLSPAKYYDTFW